MSKSCFSHSDVTVLPKQGMNITDVLICSTEYVCYFKSCFQRKILSHIQWWILQINYMEMTVSALWINNMCHGLQFWKSHQPKSLALWENSGTSYNIKKQQTQFGGCNYKALFLAYALTLLQPSFSIQLLWYLKIQNRSHSRILPHQFSCFHNLFLHLHFPSIRWYLTN